MSFFFLSFLFFKGEGLKDGKPADTRTKEQKIKMSRLIEFLAGTFDIKEIFGHNEVSNKACPCFDARAEYNHLIKN